MSRVWSVALVALLAAACGGSPPPVAALRVSVSAGALRDSVATGVPLGEGRVLTVAHVLDGARSVRVAGRGARVLRIDRRLDLAWLSVPGLAARRLPVAAAGAVATVHLLHGGPRAVRVRRVSAEFHALDGSIAERPALELATVVAPGDSGAPVTDARGRLVGIVFATGDHTAWAVRLR